MKLVKEHINFERGLDPKKAMGIGLYKDFVNVTELYDWLVENLHIVLGLKKIPGDIIKSDAYWINQKYSKKIREYVEKFLTLKGNSLEDKDIAPGSIHLRLKEMGFKE